jgi:hypothetical protein
MFFFDNSSNHDCLAPDAHITTNLDLSNWGRSNKFKLNIHKILDGIQQFKNSHAKYIDLLTAIERDCKFLSPNIVEWNVTQYKSYRRIDRLRI